MLRKAVVALSMSVFTSFDTLLSYTLVDLYDIMNDAREVEDKWHRESSSV